MPGLVGAATPDGWMVHDKTVRSENSNEDLPAVVSGLDQTTHNASSRNQVTEMPEARFPRGPNRPLAGLVVPVQFPVW